MKSSRPIGLVCAGSACRSLIARLPSLQARLGPVKASTFVHAQRLARLIGHGFAVEPLSALAVSPMIWVMVPPDQLEAALRDLAAEVGLAGKRVVVCGDARDSVELASLLPSKARLATTGPADPGDLFGPWYAEGDADILRTLRGWFKRDRLALLELRPGGKSLFQAGSQLMGDLLTPWIATATECLREAGLGNREAAELVKQMGVQAIQGLQKNGLRTPVTKSSNARRLLEAHNPVRRRVERHDSRLANLYGQALELARTYLGERVEEGMPARERSVAKGPGSETRKKPFAAASGQQ